MTQIPSDIPSSAAQAGFQAQEVSKEREARRAGQADAARKQNLSVDEAGSTVDTADEDVAVFADAEGGGGMGRATDESLAETPAEEVDSTDDDITHDDQGNPHIDLEA